MKIKTLGVILAISVLGLSGCAVGYNVSKDFQFDNKSDDGVIVVSTTLNDQCGGINLFTSFIYAKDKSVGQPFVTKNFLMSNDFKNKVGQFHIFRFKAGDYQIGRVEMGTGGSFKTSDNYNLIHFTVRPKEVTYLGDIAFRVPETCDKFYTRIIDDWSTDKMMYQQRMSKIPASEVVKRLAIYNKKSLKKK